MHITLERMPLIGGNCEKFAIPRDGSGKSSGFRIIYVFGGRHMPIFPVRLFAKKKTANLTPKERTAVVTLSKEIIHL